MSSFFTIGPYLILIDLPVQALKTIRFFQWSKSFSSKGGTACECQKNERSHVRPPGWATLKKEFKIYGILVLPLIPSISIAHSGFSDPAHTVLVRAHRRSLLERRVQRCHPRRRQPAVLGSQGHPGSQVPLFPGAALWRDEGVERDGDRATGHAPGGLQATPEIHLHWPGKA